MKKHARKRFANTVTSLFLSLFIKKEENLRLTIYKIEIVHDLPNIVPNGLLKFFKADAKYTFVSDPPAGYFFLISPAREANFGEKTFFLSSLQTSLGLPITSFLKK